MIKIVEGKTGKEIPEWSRLEFLEKFSTNNFALSDAEDNSSVSMNRGGLSDLSLLRTLLAIRWKYLLGLLRWTQCICVNLFSLGFRLI